MTGTATPPRWLKIVNPVIMLLHRLGVPVENGTVLTVPGRRSGRPRSTPLSVLDLDGGRYLLAGFPSAEWPRNVRAAGGVVTLGAGRRARTARLVELDADAAVPVLRAWPEGIPQGAKIMLDAGVVPDVSPGTFAGLAGRCAVFRIEEEAQA